MNRSGRLQRWARGCPPAWQITRAVSEDDGPFAAHIATCRTCAAEYHHLRELVVRASVLGAAADGMSHETKQAISARLLGRPQRRAPSWRFVAKPLLLAAGGAIALALCAGVWGLARRNRSVDTIAVTADAPEATSEAPTTSAPASGPVASGSSRSRASIRAVDTARFTRVARPPDEQILLQEGVIALDVVALAAGERFRVVTDDAEVEVHGTQFEVSASHGRLIAVRVTTGRVQVKSQGGALATLDAGDEWVAAASASGRATTRSDLRPSVRPAPSSVAMVPPASAPPTPNTPRATSRATSQAAFQAALNDKPPDNLSPSSPHVTAPPRPDDDRSDEIRKRRPPVTSSFDNAWSLLRKGDTRAAASAFAEVERAAVGTALEEDASYWRAVAVARSGDSPSARSLLGEFLRRFPTSSRRGEASVALGWLLLEAGQVGDARAAFERAASDPSARVRAGAREGLDRVGRR